MIFQMVADKRLSSDMLAAFDYVITFHDNIHSLIKKCCYDNRRSKICPPSWSSSWVFKHFISSKISETFDWKLK